MANEYTQSVDLSQTDVAQDNQFSLFAKPDIQGVFSATVSVETPQQTFSGTGLPFVQCDNDASATQAAVVKVTSQLESSEVVIAEAHIPAGESEIVVGNPAFVKNSGRVLVTADGSNPVTCRFSFMRIPQPVSLTLESGNGNTLRESLPDSNLAGTLITANGNDPNQQRGLIRFDLSTIPSTAQVIAARIDLTLVAGNSITDPCKIFPVLQSWDASEVSWNERSSGVAWSTAGMEAGVDYDEAALTSIFFDTDLATSYSIDVTELVRQWVSGTADNNGVAIIQDDSTNLDNVELGNFGNATAASRPDLIVEYQ